MAIYAPPPLPFDCVICGKPQMQNHWDNRNNPLGPIPPICRICEIDYGKTGPGGRYDTSRDRRTIRQISALAEAIMTTAYCKQNGLPHG